MSLAIVDRRAHGLPIEPLRHIWNTAHARAVMFTLLENNMEHLPGGFLRDAASTSSIVPVPPSGVSSAGSVSMEVINVDPSEDIDVDDFKSFQSDLRKLERLHEQQLDALWDQPWRPDEIEHHVHLFLLNKLEVILPTDTEPAQFRAL